MKLSYNDEDRQFYGEKFEDAFLDTDPEMDLINRYGEACILIVDAILEEVLANLQEDVDDGKAESQAEDLQQ